MSPTFRKRWCFGLVRRCLQRKRWCYGLRFACNGAYIPPVRCIQPLLGVSAPNLQEADAELELYALDAVGASLELQEAGEINLVHSHRARDKSNSP